MRTADGDRKVATWALQLPVSRCLPALGNAAQLSRPLFSAQAHRVGEWAALRIRHFLVVVEANWSFVVVEAHGGGVGGTGMIWSWRTPSGFRLLRQAAVDRLSSHGTPLSRSAWNVRRPSPAWKLPASRVAEAVLLILAVCVV